MSSPSEPVDTTDKSLCTWASPIFMIEPLPNCFSIWASAAASALLLLSSIEFIPLDLTKLMLLIAAPFLVDRPGDCCIERSFDTTPFGLGQTVDQALQSEAHGFAADRRPVARQKALLCLVHRGAGPGETDGPDGFFGASPRRPGDTCDCHRPLGAARPNRALSHCQCDLLADGAEAVNRIRRDPKLLDLGGVGIGHKAPLEPVGAARDRSDDARDQP